MKSIVVMPAYNAAKTLSAVANNIPSIITEVILVDDFSSDDTVIQAEKLNIRVIRHSNNKGYGANQKTCYKAALKSGADIVVMVHPDGQYDPSRLAMIISNFNDGTVGAVYGSRMTGPFSLKGPMPLWRYFSNIVLGRIANFVTAASLSDWHTGYRGYTKSALEAIDFEKFPNGFEFDTSMTLALLKNKISIIEIPVPVKYFPDASSINFIRSIKYGFNFLLQIVTWKKL